MKLCSVFYNYFALRYQLKIKTHCFSLSLSITFRGNRSKLLTVSMGRTCGITDTTGNKCTVKIRLLKEIAFPSEEVIVMIIQGYNWVLNFETGQVMM